MLKTMESAILPPSWRAQLSWTLFGKIWTCWLLLRT